MPYSSRLCLSIRGWKTERTSLFIVFINLTMRSCVAVEIVLCIVFSSHHVENKITRRVTDGGAAEGAVSPSSHLFPPLEEKRGNVQVIYFYPPPVQCVCPRLKNPVENRRTPVTPIFYLIFFNRDGKPLLPISSRRRRNRTRGPPPCRRRVRQ